jgi:phage terminase large subunit-like protein
MYLFVDPPITHGPKADKCGLAVLGYAPGTGRLPSEAQRQFLKGDDWKTTLTKEEALAQGRKRLSTVCVLHAEEVQLTAGPLYAKVLQILDLFPDITAVVVEVNQGGPELWRKVFEKLPVKLITFTSSIKKEVRIARSLDLYQKHRVTHARPFGTLEDAQTAYPKVEYDDLIDAASTGTLQLLAPKGNRQNSTIRQR